MLGLELPPLLLFHMGNMEDAVNELARNGQTATIEAVVWTACRLAAIALHPTFAERVKLVITETLSHLFEI